MDKVFTKLKKEKIEINWNKKPIEMKLFLSFLTIEVVRSTDHLGYVNGWTELENKEHKLIIRGGKVNGNEYLNDIQYGVKLANRFNNYVNPFYLFDILNDDGKQFFLKYYEKEIREIISNQRNHIDHLRDKLKEASQALREMKLEIIHIKQ